MLNSFESMLLAWVLMWELVCELVKKPVLDSSQERQSQACFPLSLGFFFFPGHFSPAFVRFGLIRGFRLDLTRILFCCCFCRLLTADGGRGDCGDCGKCGGCSVLQVLFGAKLCDMPQLLVAPTERASSFHDHHHLPLSADNNFRDGQEALPSQT